VPLPPGAAVYDLIYKPLETQLLRQARQVGLAAVNGLGMLIEQAALSFERWTGARVDRSALWSEISPS
jgi:shikimate dehydrogenase